MISAAALTASVRPFHVENASHTARARLPFNKIPERHGVDIRIEMAAAENPVYNEANWRQTETGMTSYYLEPLKFLVYFFRRINLSFFKAS